MTQKSKKSSSFYVPKYKHKLLRDVKLRNKLRIMVKFEPYKAIKLLLDNFPYGLNIISISKNLDISHIVVVSLLKEYDFKYRKVGTNRLYQN